MAQTDCQIILTTCPDMETATEMANTLVDKGLAACVNILPGLTSIYQWKGDRQCGEELLLMIKTQSNQYTAIESTILSQHPYELPEIISVPIEIGFTAYLDWINTSTGKQ